MGIEQTTNGVMNDGNEFSVVESVFGCGRCEADFASFVTWKSFLLCPRKSIDLRSPILHSIDHLHISNGYHQSLGHRGEVRCRVLWVLVASAVPSALKAPSSNAFNLLNFSFDELALRFSPEIPHV